jgi:hypothetical protein
MLSGKSEYLGAAKFVFTLFLFFQFYWNTCIFKIGMVKELTGGYKIKYHANGLDKDPIEIDFTPPFRSVRYCCFSSTG